MTASEDMTEIQIDDNTDTIDIIDDHDHDGHKIKEEETNVYKETFWPARPEEPKGFTFKGKSKMMTYSMEKAKSILKKGTEKEINGKKKFKVLDSRKQGGATQIAIEVSDSEGRGNAIVDFWGPKRGKNALF